MTIGPVQLVVLGFEGNSLTGEILAELRRLRDHDVIRLIDLLFVSKDESGEVTVMEASDLTQEEAMEFGATVGALIGLGEAGEQGAVAGAVAGAEALEDGHVFDEHEVWYVTDSIPNGSSAAVALLEHRWAIPLGTPCRARAVRYSTNRGCIRSTSLRSAWRRRRRSPSRAEPQRRVAFRLPVAEECLS